MNQHEQATEVQHHGRPGLIPQQLIRATNISPEAKVIYGLLSTYKEAFPGQKWIAARCPASIPTVISRLHELEARGWLFREERNRRAGETDIYHIFMVQEPLDRRKKWVTMLNKTAQEINELPQRTLLKEINLIPFTKLRQGKLLEALDAQSIKKLEEKKSATPPSPKRSLKGLSRQEVISVYRESPTAPPPGLTRPQVLAAVLDHTEGFHEIVDADGWPKVMMRLGQMFNGHRKVSLEYQDIIATAIDLQFVPKPRGKPASINYLIAVLSNEANERMMNRYEAEAQSYKQSATGALEGLSAQMRTPEMHRIPRGEA